jgi:hypothetical protein
MSTIMVMVICSFLFALADACSSASVDTFVSPTRVASGSDLQRGLRHIPEAADRENSSFHELDLPLRLVALGEPPITSEYVGGVRVSNKSFQNNILKRKILSGIGQICIYGHFIRISQNVETLAWNSWV